VGWGDRSASGGIVSSSSRSAASGDDGILRFGRCTSLPEASSSRALAATSKICCQRIDIVVRSGQAMLHASKTPSSSHDLQRRAFTDQIASPRVNYFPAAEIQVPTRPADATRTMRRERARHSSCTRSNRLSPSSRARKPLLCGATVAGAARRGDRLRLLRVSTFADDLCMQHDLGTPRPIKLILARATPNHPKQARNE